MNAYRGMFVLSASLKDDAVQEVIDRIRSEIATLKGVAGAVKVTGKRTFARPLKKVEMGQYVQMWMQLAPDSVTPLRNRINLNEDILRCQVLRMSDDEFIPAAPVGLPEEDAPGGGAAAEAAAAPATAAKEAPQESTTAKKEA